PGTSNCRSRQRASSASKGNAPGCNASISASCIAPASPCACQCTRQCSSNCACTRCGPCQRALPWSLRRGT
ncbi:hypothetical protein WR25_14790, partial [Diploscapter pachys]